MNKRPKVSVVIPAANEEANIENIVLDVLSQKRDIFSLKRLTVVCDGSTDDTVKVLKKINNPLLKIKIGRKRRGKVARLNDYFKGFDADILVQLDADIRLAGKNVLNSLIKEFLKSENVDLVFGLSFAAKPAEHFEKIAYFGYEMWNTAIKLTGKKMRYYANGQIRAFSKRFLSRFSYPEKNIDISEDTYLFYFAATKGFKMNIARGAKVYFKLADNFSDYLAQMNRFLKAPLRMEEFFGKENVEEYEVITKKIRIKSLIIQFIKSPLLAMQYVVVQTLVRIITLFLKTKVNWDLSLSSKRFSQP